MAAARGAGAREECVDLRVARSSAARSRQCADFCAAVAGLQRESDRKIFQRTFSRTGAISLYEHDSRGYAAAKSTSRAR